MHAVAYLTLDIAQWAEESFGTCDLHDARRTRRAVIVAQQMAQHPDGSSPTQAEKWSDLKALYRLFNRSDVTFDALAEPHWRRTRSLARGRVLLIGDTTETDFGCHRSVTGLGPTGDGYGLGFLLHNSMMVDAGGEIIGLAAQELFYRRPAPEGENSYQAMMRSRESEVWGRVIDKIGAPAPGTQYVHVFDRGADNLEVFCHCRAQRTDWLIRAAQLHRAVEGEDGQRDSLRKTLDKQPLAGTYQLSLRATSQHVARTATLEVRYTKVTIRCPKRRTPYLRDIDFQELTQWVVEVSEAHPPKGVTRLNWVLWTSLPIHSLEDARQVISDYEQRWLIEEFHKAIKTGCRLEDRQYEEAASLEAVAGLSSVLAVRLLQLKTVAKSHPDLPATDIIPKIWIEMLSALRKKKLTTVRDFFRHLAGLGGFLMRKRDGEPGWITLWRGLDKLLLAVRGHLAMR